MDHDTSYKKIGMQLCSAREKAGLTLAQLHQITRIETGIIESIEAGEIGKLADVHFRGFVRTLAAELKCDTSIFKWPDTDINNDISNSDADNTIRSEKNRPAIAMSIFLSIIIISVILLYIFKGVSLFKNQEIPETSIWYPDTAFAVANFDTTHPAMTGILKPVIRSQPIRKTVPVKKTESRLRGPIQLKELFKIYPIYAERRDLYLPNAVTLSRLEALNPELQIDIYFSPEDSIAQQRIPPLLQIHRAAYLPNTTWTLTATTEHYGLPVTVISQNSETLIRWSRPTEKRIETILFEIADVVVKLNLNNIEMEIE
ncbi:helix-turn-helix domain-containing protein [bacterium]|nr:helix-turn-helix domain-containing protein [bacterium]